MSKPMYKLDCGGFPLRCSFLYPETQMFFTHDLEKCEEDKDLSAPMIRLTPEYLEKSRWLVSENEASLPFREYHALMLATGNYLLSYHRALFHGAALLWNNKAWILTGPSGTGKTTQLRHWRDILRRDVRIINGDKPLLSVGENGIIQVHSSPWRGKEKYGQSGLCAPLGGIILLQQGKENRMERLSASEAVLPLFTEFISFPENTQEIRCQAEILDQILDAVPVWKLTNRGDRASALLTLETLASGSEDRS